MLRFLETLVVALMGVTFFSLIKLPLPWMLGPLIMVLMWNAVIKREVYWPRLIRNTGLAGIGFMMGISFNRDTLMQISSQLPSMFFVTVASIIFSGFIGYITHKVSGVSLCSSIIGNVPGGLSQMLALSEEIPGTDITVVTFMQSIRLLSTLFIVPFFVIHGLADNPGQMFVTSTDALKGAQLSSFYGLSLLFLGNVIFAALLAQRLQLPTPFLLGPLLGTAILVLTGVPSFSPPHFLSGISQLCIGSYMGTNIKLANMKSWKKLLPCSLIGSITSIMFSLGVGVFLSYTHHLTYIDSFLSTAPGGTAEMAITAMTVNGNVSLVSAYQLFRVVFILLVISPIIKRWLRDEDVHITQARNS